MRENFCDITVVLDRSGSREAVADDTIGGFNRFLLDQKQAPGDGVLTLVQFDNVYEFVHKAKPLAEVPALTRETFVPRGATALLDAMGRALNETFERLQGIAKTDEAQLPDAVIFVILTDGLENSSREFTREMVFKQIKERTEKHGWKFVYLGANQDAIQAAESMGIAAGSSMTYGPTGHGTRMAMHATSRSVRAMRAKMAGNFTAEEREQQKKEGAK